MQRALALMDAHPDAPWTVEQLAARVGLSRSAFAAQFARALGEPPLRYLARVRVARAAQLLRETDLDITAVAERVGYESVPSFGKAFKRWRYLAGRVSPRNLIAPTAARKLAPSPPRHTMRPWQTNASENSALHCDGRRSSRS